MLTTAACEGLAFDERLALLVEQERLLRDERTRERLGRQARFKLLAAVADIDYQQAPERPGQKPDEPTGPDRAADP